MRGLIAWAAPLLALTLGACASGPALPPVEGPLVELAHDEGRLDDKPNLPGRQLELLVRFDPKLPAYRLRRMRFLLAQPGRIVFTFYRALPDGNPGEMVAEIDRHFGPELVSAPEAVDRRWVLEDLAAVPLSSGPFVVGVAAPEREGDPRLWAAGEGTGHVFEREWDGSIGRFRHAPVLRIELQPTAPLAPAPLR